MALKYLKQNIVEVKRGIVAHGCNCQGVMGSGVAKAVRSKWPEAYQRYAEICEGYDRSSDLLGLTHFVFMEKSSLVVANCFTQHSYGKDGKKYADPEAIEIALEQVFMLSRTTTLPIYMPKIGCGLGGLSWEQDVEPIVARLMVENPEVEVNICDI